MTKNAYLTIDDSPSADMQQKIDFLLEKSIPALWFCRGDLLERRQEHALYAIKKGFHLGNHAYDHPFFSDLSLEECFSQIRTTDEIIDDLYRKAGIQRDIKYFRFPYGDKGGFNYTLILKKYSEAGLKRKQAIQKYLREIGYTKPKFDQISYNYFRQAGLNKDTDWYWTFDAMEWSIFQENKEQEVDNIEKVFARMDDDEPENFRGLNYPESADIILMHDHKETTVYFQPIIERLLKKGLTFIQPV